jgi:hypothetical protein
VLGLVHVGVVASRQRPRPDDLRPCVVFDCGYSETRVRLP